jgi:hypothetical protein
MNTLSACRKLFEQHGHPILSEAFPEIMDTIAAARIGGGSDVLGANDKYSRDGDWGATFDLFLPDVEYAEFGQSIREVLQESLPPYFEGFPTASGGGPKIGVYSLRGYLRERLGLSHFPETQTQWLKVPESALCGFTNGEVFFCPSGQLTEIRRKYESYYPSDVWKVHIARAVYTCWFYGENSYGPRLARRGDQLTAMVARGVFCRSAMQLVFLLNREYAPYWKWLHWRFVALPKYASPMDPMLHRIVLSDDLEEQAAIIEDVCVYLKDAIRNSGVVEEGARMEYMGAYDIMRTLGDPELARQPLRTSD